MVDGPVTLLPGDQPTIVTAVGLSVYSGVWLGALCALAIAVVLLSTHAQRRDAVFLIQTVAFPMAVVSALLHVVLNAQLIVYLTTHNPITQYVPDFYGLRVATKAFEMLTPLVCDVTLIFKAASFYPSTLYPRRWQRIGPLLPLLVLAVARLGTCIACVTFVLHNTGRSARLVAYDLNVLDIVEYSLQFFFCLYACVLLFRKLYELQRNRRHISTSAPRKRKLRFLIEATAMTFVLPLAAQIGAVAAAATGQGVIYVCFAYSNIYLSLVCSVLATSWSTIRASRSFSGSPESTSNGAGGVRPSSQRALFGSVPRWPFGARRRHADDVEEEDSKSTTSSEREVRQVETVVDEAQQQLQPHETLLASIFDDEAGTSEASGRGGVIGSFSSSEDMEVLTSIVHRQSQLSASSADASMPQRLARPEATLRSVSQR